MRSENGRDDNMRELYSFDTDEMRFIFCSYCNKWVWVRPETVMHCSQCGRDITRSGEIVVEVNE